MEISFHKPGSPTPEVLAPPGDCVRIGRAPDSDLVLNAPFVALEAAVLERRNGGWDLLVLQFANIKIGDRKLNSGDRVTLSEMQTVNIFPFDLVIKIPHSAQEAMHERLSKLSAEVSELIREIHRQLREQPQSRLCIDKIKEKLDLNQAVLDSDILQLEQFIDQLARLQKVAGGDRRDLALHIAGVCIQSEMLNRLVESISQSGIPAWYSSQSWSRMASQIPAREVEVGGNVRSLLEATGARQEADFSRQMDVVQERFWEKWELQSRHLLPALVDYLVVRQLQKELKDMLYGLGPLEDLLKIPAITEIMVVDRDHIYVERNNRIEKSGRRFVSDDITIHVINRIVRKVGKSINMSEPLVDARMPDGSRVNAIIPPLTVSGPCLTIRRFPAKRLRIDDLVEKKALTSAVADFLRASVASKKNIIISGGTGSGKTTLLNCLADSIPERDRIVTIEDTAELQIPREHCVRLEARKPNAEGKGGFTIGDLVRNALRMRPDRIVVGECRGAEAMDMLQAMNTGHSGSMTTIHANTAFDVIQRLEVLVQMADVKLPISSIHRQITSAVDLIVQLSRLRDGSRCVTQVTEVLGVDDATGQVRLRDLFLHRDSPPPAMLQATGHLPSFMSELIDRGLVQLQTFYLDETGETVA